MVTIHTQLYIAFPLPSRGQVPIKTNTSAFKHKCAHCSDRTKIVLKVRTTVENF